MPPPGLQVWEGGPVMGHRSREPLCRNNHMTGAVVFSGRKQPIYGETRERNAGIDTLTLLFSLLQHFPPRFPIGQRTRKL